MTQHNQVLYQAQQKAFEDILLLIEIVRRCETPEDYYHVQQQLEEHIDRIDEAAEDAKRHKAEQERKFYHRLSHQYRTVGDAIAWQVYAFQALPIYALGRNQFPGYRTRAKRKGLDEEIARIKILWETEGAFALHHDCTNCLRIGDLSVFYPDQLNMPELVEVKVTGRDTPSHQKRRMKVASDLATNHYSIQDEIYDLLHQSRASEPIEEVEQTNLGLLWQALLQARERGIGFAANSYLAITVLDSLRRNMQHPEQPLQEWNETTNEMLSPDIWPCYCADELNKDSWEHMAHPNIGGPYTIYPLPSDYVTAIVTGAIRIHYRLNTGAITEVLGEAGFEAKCLLGEWRRLGQQPPRKAKPPYFLVQRDGISMPLESLPIHQMMFEGLRLKDFVETIVSSYDEKIWNKIPASETDPQRRPLHMVATFTNMERIWASSRNYLLPISYQTANTDEDNSEK